MTTIRERVFTLWRENQDISVADLRLHLPKANSQTLSDYLSEARKGKSKVTKITEQEIEKAILSLANKSVVAKKDMIIVKMMIDFLKIKRADSGLEDDLDISKYLKKVDKL